VVRRTSRKNGREQARGVQSGSKLPHSRASPVPRRERDLNDAETLLGAKVAESLGESVRSAQDRLQFEAVPIKNTRGAINVGRQIVKVIFTVVVDLMRHAPSLSQAGAGGDDMKSGVVATRDFKPTRTFRRSYR
jgi:hypothetical protein